MSAIRFLSVSGVMTLALLTSSCSKPASPANTPSSTSATTAHQSEAAQGVPAGAVPAMRAGKAPSEDRATVTLKLGSQAPPLAVRKWVKGEPIAKFAPGQLYVVEFWATWCGPCVKAMPDITELAKKHQGKVTFIGMDVDDPSDEGVVAKVEKFVANQGDKIGYPIALDTEDGQMQKRWLDAAGLQSIPQSFVIDGKGTLVWIGHPGELDKVLDAVLAGKPVPVSTNDGEAEMKAMMAKVRPMQKALKQKDYATAMTHIEELLKMPGGAQFAPLKYQVLAETAGSAKANEYARQILDGKLPEGIDRRD